MLIRSLIAKSDLAIIREFYAKAPDYWQLTEGQEPGLLKTRDFFIDTPPNCDPEGSLRLGLFLDDRLSGLAELSFGFPTAGDPYLGLMVLGPWARNHGNSKKFFGIYRDLRPANRMRGAFLAVHDINPRGRASWEREGFSAIGDGRAITIGDIHTKIHRLAKAL